MSPPNQDASAAEAHQVPDQHIEYWKHGYRIGVERVSRLLEESVNTCIRASDRRVDEAVKAATLAERKRIVAILRSSATVLAGADTDKILDPKEPS